MGIDPKIEAAHDLFRQRMKEVMDREGFTHVNAFAAWLQMPSATLYHYFSQESPRLPGPETLVKIRERIPEITDEDAQIIGVGFSRKIALKNSRDSGSSSSPKKGKGKKSKASVNASSQVTKTGRTEEGPLHGNDAAIGRLVRQLVTAVLRSDDTALASGARSRKVSFSELKEQYQIQDISWVISKKNFESINVSSWTQQEKQQFLDVTNRVLEQSRLCLMLLAQFVSDDIRDELAEKIATEADMLWRTYKVASSVVPIQYVQDIDLAQRTR